MAEALNTAGEFSPAVLSVPISPLRSPPTLAQKPANNTYRGETMRRLPDMRPIPVAPPAGGAD